MVCCLAVQESLRRALQRFANVANKLTYVRQFVTDALQYPASGKGQPCGPSRPSHAATRGASATTTTQHPPTTGAPPAAVGSDNGWHGSPVGNGCCQTVQAFASAVNEHVGVSRHRTRPHIPVHLSGLNALTCTVCVCTKHMYNTHKYCIPPSGHSLMRSP